jgi:IS5 family transposase
VATALGLLALVAGQDVEQDTDGTWRIAQKVAPDRVISTVDTEARHMHKSVSEYRDGYKAHLAIEPETGLVTAAALTPANAPDGKTGVTLLSDEEPGLQVLGDAAYGSGEMLVALGRAGHRRAIKPWPKSTAIPGGFDRDDFFIDEAAGTATCPAGHTVTITPHRRATFGALCRACPLRERCTKSKNGRVLHLHPHDAELVESRRAWRDGDFAEDYRRWRPMVECSLSWLVANGNRRVRFRGVERNQLGLSLRLAAINLRRLVNLGLVNDGSWMLPAA